ncbi:ABC transporter permease [Paenibacillus hunanensis]|uniref:ABC transporter permease n=1 Tax=Paenibacillus hunanensis TaxID=539262 RepID=UPI002A6B1E10|nr:ABC transporter permease [Paenibacillus hunanensis]WPP41751.1 ABC transporter permease [Paenibacillus hunanensis]
MNPAIAADRIKLKRSFITPLSYVYPLFIIAAALIIMAAQQQKLMEQGSNMWYTMVAVIHFLIMFVVPIKLTIIVSNLINVEHQTNAWKLLFALPVKRSSLYFSKLFYVLRVCAVSAIFLFIGFIVIGNLLGFAESPPYSVLLKEAVYPYIGALPIITFQLWLSMKFKNQAFAITIGIFGAICMFFLQMNTITSYLFWAYPARMTPLVQVIENNELAGIVPNPDIAIYMVLSIIFGLLFMLLGLRQFRLQETD